MFTVKYNGTDVPGVYDTRELAVKSVENNLGPLNFNEFDIAFWPHIGARGNIMIEIVKIKGVL